MLENESSTEKKVAVSEEINTYRFLFTVCLVFFSLYFAFEYWLVLQPFYIDFLEFFTRLTSSALNSWLGEQSSVWSVVGGQKLEIRSGDGSYIRVTPYSTGIFFAIALIAGVVAQAAIGWARKIVAVLIGVALVFCLAFLKTIAVYKTSIYLSRYFHLMNDWVLPAVFALLLAIYFYCWILLSIKRK